MSLEPLQKDLSISFLVCSSPKNRIAGNRESTVVASIISALKELGNLLLCFPITKLVQAAKNESVKDYHILAKAIFDRLEVLLEVLPKPPFNLKKVLQKVNQAS